MNIDKQFDILNKDYCKRNNLKLIDPNNQGNSKYIHHYKKYIYVYQTFFKKYNPIGSILDFGCGPAFSVYIGNLSRYNILGLDIDQKEFQIDDNVYTSIYNILNINNKIKFYDGHHIPFEDNSFDNILSSWSILFDYSINEGRGCFLNEKNELLNKRLHTRLKELIRISKINAVWYICPLKHWNTIKEIFNVYNNKNIKIITFHIET